MVGIRHQSTHLGGISWFLINGVAGEGTWASIENPWARPRHPGIFRGYRVEEEMDMHTRQNLGEAKCFVGNFELIRRIEVYLIDSYI